MSDLFDIMNQGGRTAHGNFNLNKAVLAINGAGAATVKTTNALSYVIDGVQYSASALAAKSIAVTHDWQGKAVAAANAATATAVPAYVQPVSTTAYYLLCVNAAGTIAVVQGSYAGQAISYAPGDPSKVLVGTGNTPVEPAGYTAFGLIKVVTNGSATFTPGTTLLDAAGLTVSYFDLARVPTNRQP
jgi:hypothetical protein